MPKISPFAVVDSKARIAEDVQVGPFCVIGPDVALGSGCVVHNNVTIVGHTTLGKNNEIFPNAVIGAAPQDKKFHGEATRLEIGDDNQIREAVTIHLGTEKGGGITRVGSNNLFMVNVHVGHDVQFGSECILANNTMLAGHVVVHDRVAMMGGVGIHHFVTVGEYAYLSGYARIHHDVPPFCKVDGADIVRGINSVGLRRAGEPEADIEALEEAVRDLFYRDKPFATVMAEFDLQNGLNPKVKSLLDFLRRRDGGKHGRWRQARSGT